MSDVYVPRAADWINALEAGQQASMTRQKQQSQKLIGGAMARGDYKGAAAAAYGSGDYATGSQIETLGTKRKETERRKEYGAQYAAGKGSDAVKSAMGDGDFELAGDIQKALDAATKAQKDGVLERASRVAEIVAPLGEIPETDMAGRRAYIQQHTGDLIAAGYTQEQLAAFEPTNANLAPIYTQALGLKDYLSYRNTEADNAREDAKPLIIPETSNVYMRQPQRPASSSPLNVAPPPPPISARAAPDTLVSGGETAPGVVTGAVGSDTLIGSDAPTIDGYALVQRARPPKEAQPKERDHWVDLPGGGQRNTRTNKVEGLPSGDKAPAGEAKKTVAFAFRTLRANDRLNALADEGIVKPTAWKLVSDKNGATRLALSNQNDRRFVSAAKEWLAPILRKDTGAAVSDSEFLYYADMYIPAPEDGPELLKQKAEARQDAMIALVREAGPLYDQTHGNRNFRSKFPAKAKEEGRTQGDGWRIVP